MKAQDFMIGDWVESSIEGIGRITEIARDGRIALTYGNNKNAVVGKIEHLQPIPLTGEILEKNGFKQRNEYYHITIENKDTRYCVEYDTESRKLTVNNVWFVINELRYVHELQHALKLCGIDKNIEL